MFQKITVVAMWQEQTRRETLRTRLIVVEMDTSIDLGCTLEMKSLQDLMHWM